MARQDEGPLDTVGWGPFAPRSERRRLIAAEAARMAEVAATRQAEPPPLAQQDVPADTLALLVSRAATLLEQDPLPLANRAELHGIAEALKRWDNIAKAGRGTPTRVPESWHDYLMSAYRAAADQYFRAQKRKAEDQLIESKAAAARQTAEAIQAARGRPHQPPREVAEQEKPTARNSA